MSKAVKNVGKDQYGRFEYPVIAVDIAVFALVNGVLNILMMRSDKKELNFAWSIPGALVRADEGLEDAVNRTLKTKAKLEGVLSEQMHTFGNPARDPFGRVVSVAYVGLVDSATQSEHDAKIFDDSLKWVPVKDARKLAYDHDEMVLHALKTLRSKLTHTNFAQGILGEYFTLSELQTAYEIILGTELDKRNFRRKVLELEMVEATGKKVQQGASRPAELFTFKEKSVREYSMVA